MSDYRNRNVTIGGLVRDAGFQPPLAVSPVTNREIIAELPPSPARIGEFVLFCIGPNLLRPLLVVALGEMGKVHGLLFLDSDKDRSAPWVKKWAFTPPTKTQPFQYVENVGFGEEQGKWRKKDREVREAVSLAGLQQIAEAETEQDFDPRKSE